MLSDILFLRAWSSTFSLFFVFEEKSPYRVGRHVEINLKLIHMASGVKTHMVGRHVENSLRIANMAFWV